MIKIAYNQYAAFTPAFALIVEGWNELVQAGLTPEGQADAPFAAASEVLYAEREDGEIVGALCFNRHEPRREFKVVLAYVEPTSRKQGVFTDLLEVLKTKAREDKIAQITGDAHADNQVMQAVMARLQAQPMAVTFETLITV